MKIIRFLDEHDRQCYGHDYSDGHAILLEGELFREFTDTGHRISVKKILAPLEPTAIFGIAFNYRQHAAEAGYEKPKNPVFFFKNPASVNHPGDPIVIPQCCEDIPQVDWEAELAVVIGRAAKNVPVSEALQYVKGYAPTNDISARHWQKHAGAGQVARGKSFDTFCPLGPELITADEIPDPQSLNLQCLLNGEIMQDSNTSQMIFSVAELIAYLSMDTTLLPGSVILSGTPGGVGFARTPPVFLKSGDIIEVAIEGMQTLSNPVVSV
jgi:2-keto-4-pentenoate hydratase/2-oxohepta-3-ene-1,7-dioic acid hydratase in catechol pathway